jgi:predicted DNA-binding transcriptional regulator YafY
MHDLNQRQKGASKEQAKIRVLLIEKMLRYDRRISTKEIQDRLDAKYDMQVSRRTLRQDLAAIDKVVPLDVTRGYGVGYKKLNIREV